MTLATARRVFPDQLRPFRGLQDYSMDEDFYNGTLYRLPFRSTEHTSLKETPTFIGIDETKVLLEDYHSTAQMSLLFLRSVETIDFRIRGRTPSWSVTARRQGGSVDDIFQDINIASSQQSGATSEALWRIGITDIEKAPKELVNAGRHANKITECGLAARLKLEGSPMSDLPNQVFCTLPTGFSIQLPVSVHASFAITGDRKTIPYEDTKQNSTIAAWNRWLLTECIPSLYLDFLKDLAPRLGEKVFGFWPSLEGVTWKQGFGDVIHKAFWNRLADERFESYQLFPLVETRITTEQSTPLKTRRDGKKRKLFEVTSLKSAQFDVLRRTTSAKLMPLFSKLCPNWVRPRHLWHDMVAFKIHLRTTIIGSQHICKLFKLESNCIILESFLERLEAEATNHKGLTTRDEAMKLLLQIALPDSSSMEWINGCRIMPMLDQTLGTIKFQTGDGVTWSRCDLLFLPSLAEADLFAHRANSLIKPSLFREDAPKHATLLVSFDPKPQPLRNPLLDLLTESSNLRTIGISDIESFLVHVDASSVHHSTNDNMDAWIIRFWAYLDPRLQTLREGGNIKTKAASANDLLKALKLHDTPIYRYHDGASWHYITPQQFEGGPYIVAPSDRKEHDLCKLLPGVKAVDPNCLPLQLKDMESSLNEPPGFSRLLRALTATGTIRIPRLSEESPGYECIQVAFR